MASSSEEHDFTRSLADPGARVLRAQAQKTAQCMCNDKNVRYVMLWYGMTQPNACAACLPLVIVVVVAVATIGLCIHLLQDAVDVFLLRYVALQSLQRLGIGARASAGGRLVHTVVLFVIINASALDSLGG